ncbi:hypothetical protein MtrunA17_Chr1g0149141 [Medicago truncatula]|uniref:Ubiquitin family protein n=1 Tax=Medicago truncatula TaxID=3880 RepID=B7FMR6_MEDTR|nr:vicilin-like seed storage protein At2g18540 [Medicago truncatula]XP_003588739.1 vicilin-like seed storage protein At2g18540 [Medicago truncatula]ACJ86049.1 unknown [Medicago truncatula]AES58985.1 ubiquitin family protein [Medicago truncatula]AES58990.1 ubiquitin family protein [Medicago truncatula]RHN76921.1 hypothetical protein MtrunA17_Chr1g0149141 [Medicago truncatula]
MVFIVPPSGEKFSLDVNPNTTTLHQLKVAIQQFNGMPVSNQRLFFSLSLGQNDSDLISNLGIGPFSTLTLHTPFYGGADDDTIGATSSTVKDELVKEVDSDSESESESESDAKARADSEYLIYPDSDSDVDDKIEKRRQSELFEIRRRRNSAKFEEQRMSIFFKNYEEKFCAEMERWWEEEDKKFLEEEKEAEEELLKEIEEDRKQAEEEARKKVKRARKAEEVARKKVKRAKKAEEAEAKAKD